jgi:glucokinase
VNVLNPEMIVIAGGAAAGWELLAGTVRQTMMEKAFQRPAERVKLVPAELGDNAGILGAAQVALQHKPPFIK